MFKKYFIVLFLNISNFDGAYVQAPYLQWNRQEHLVPKKACSKMLPYVNNCCIKRNFLFNSAYPFKNTDLTHSYNNQLMDHMPLNLEHYPAQKPNFPPYDGVHFNPEIYQPNMQSITQLKNRGFPQLTHNFPFIYPSFRGMEQPQPLVNFHRPFGIIQPKYRNCLKAQKNMQRITCISIYPRTQPVFNAPAFNIGSKPATFKVLPPAAVVQHAAQPAVAHTIHNPVPPVAHTIQNPVSPVAHAIQNPVSPVAHPIPIIINHPQPKPAHSNPSRGGGGGGRRRGGGGRRRRHGSPGLRIHLPRIHIKDIGHELLKGLHASEDLAASGALGPQFKAAAIAAKSAETLINGAIRGESAAQIMKETAMTAANAAMGGGMKEQLLRGVAAKSGIPLPPGSGGNSSGGPLGMAGGGSLKQQLIHQAEHQALDMAINSASKHIDPNQANQIPVGTVAPVVPPQPTQPLQSSPVLATNAANITATPVQSSHIQQSPQQQMPLLQPRF